MDTQAWAESDARSRHHHSHSANNSPPPTTIQTGPQRPTSDTRTIDGHVKWFDTTKGYGFLVPDNGGPDILIHYKLLDNEGCKSLPEGARLTVRAITGPRGQQAVEILSLQLPETNGPTAAAAGRNSAGKHTNPLDYLDMAGDFEPVEVCWFNRARGYGFLLRGDGVTQIFVHMETVRRARLPALVAGQHCRARIHDGPRGALAVEIATD